MKKSQATRQILLLVLALAAASVAAPGLSAAGAAKGVRLSPGVGDPQNDFLAIQVAAEGFFNMGANPGAPPCGEGPTFVTPCRYNLMFQWPDSPGTSFTTVRIDNSDFPYDTTLEFGDVQFPTDDDSHTTNTSRVDFCVFAADFCFVSRPIRVTQELKIVPGLTGNPDTARIRYVVTNLDGASHAVGLRIMLDMMLNDNDGAPFRVNGEAVTIETDYVGTNVPSFFDVFSSSTLPWPTRAAGCSICT